jgi:thiol-disulfide isomerase/thioredoxin
MKKSALLQVLALLLVMGSMLALSGCEYFRTEEVEETEEAIEESASEDAEEDNHQEIEGNYRPYSLEEFEEAEDGQRVLFFHAAWCPSCQAADAELTEREAELPDDVVVYKVDYDTEMELKEKYAITYQHTFVLVDGESNELKKWNGGDIDEILENVE